MDTKKIVINLLSIFIKIIAAAIVTLFSTRIALNALGVDSFGLYNLIAGIIVLFSFFNGSLSVSVQRYLSISIGEKDWEKLNKIFNNSLIIHIIIGIVLCLLFVITKPILFNGILKIKTEDIIVAKQIFDLMIISAFVTIVSIPYIAIINSREDIWFLSVSELIVSLCKFLAAVYLIYAEKNLLISYTILIVTSLIIGFIIRYFWCIYKYQESKIDIKKHFDISLLKEMIGFTSWNTLGSAAVVGRNQGIALVLNSFFGTVLNAAYGIANQLNALIITFSSTLTTVFSPSIMQSKGAGDDSKMLFIAIFSSKLSFLISGIISIPFLLHTNIILELWLGIVPLYTEIFSQIIILSFIILQLYPGLVRALYAEGNIKWYQIIISLILLSVIPVGVFFFEHNYAPVTILYYLLVAQILTLIVTIIFASHKVNLNKRLFIIKSCVIPISTLTSVLLLGIILNEWLVFKQFYKIFLTSVITESIFILLFYKYTLITRERKAISKIISSKLKFTI